jgi:uncharacterized membrane protein HdeD (DUF308 family)
MDHFEFLIPIAMFFAIVAAIKVITDNRTRQKMIDKGLVDEKSRQIFSQTVPYLSALKWGMVLIAVGLALFLVNLFPVALEGPASVGLMMLFAGIAFIAYYYMARSYEEKNKN